jgi:hypothetical protein
MYQEIDNNTIAITVNDWKKAGLTYKQFEHDSGAGLLSIVRRGLYGNTLIDVKSIKRLERRRVIEDYFGKIDTGKVVQRSIFRPELDMNARTFFLTQMKPDGLPIEPERQREYINRATLLNAIKDGMARQIETRARAGKKINKGEFWTLATEWYVEQSAGAIDGENVIEAAYPCTVYRNARSLERVFKSYLNEGYAALLDNRTGNDNARKVSVDTEKLLLALYRTYDKPFINRVHELYHEFVSGNKELFDKKTGLIFKPEDFRYKDGRALEISLGTVWGYLKDVVNNVSIYADRNGNFAYVDKVRPKKRRKLGDFSLSKISMDDAVLSRKSDRGWVSKYLAVDVVSGYWFRPAYIVGKPTIATVTEAFRNMFCELSELGLPMPGELEVERHLMRDIDWLGDLFPFVRFCTSPTEKRAEHKIKEFKYGAAKNAGHTRGRWFAKHEAWRAVRNKVKGDFVEPTYRPQTIVAEDLADIEKHNNELHPLQKTYPGMTRKQVMLANINPDLQPIEHWSLYRFIGNETETMIRHNDFVQCANESFEIMKFDCLKRLKPNNNNVTAYWMPEADGSISKVYLYQGDTYIGEAINCEQFRYNENAIERTDEDNANMLHQNKRLAKFDKFVKEQRADIPKIGSLAPETVAAIANIPIPENVTDTVITADEDEEFEFTDFSDWSVRAINEL